MDNMALSALQIFVLEKVKKCQILSSLWCFRDEKCGAIHSYCCSNDLILVSIRSPGETSDVTTKAKFAY